MDTTSATAFFQQLETFSKRWLAAQGLPEAGSPNGDEAWPHGHPSGVVMHYTADGRTKTCAEWLCNPESCDSAHFLVAPDRLAPTDKMFDSLPLVRMLPCTVIQLRPVGWRANHATWANAWSLGIENVNTGEVRPDKKSSVPRYFWWPNDWTANYSGPAPVAAWGRLWAPFPVAQMQTNALLVDAISALWQDRIEPARVLGHDMVQGVDTKKADGSRLAHDKRDLGPCFPIHAVRQAALGGTIETRSVEASMRRIIDSPGLVAGAWHPGIDPSYIATLKATDKPDLLQAGFYALGYLADTPDNQKTSREVFSTMMGLRQSLNGASTQAWAAALLRRLEDRFTVPALRPPSVA